MRVIGGKTTVKTTSILGSTIAISIIATATVSFAQTTEEVTQLKQLPTSESLYRNLQTEAEFLKPPEEELKSPLPSINLAQTSIEELTSDTPVEQGFYGSVSGDWRFFNSVNFTGVNIPTLGAVDAIEAEFDSGFGINGSLGYKFPNNLRLEGQVSYGRNEVGDVNLPGIPAAFGTPVIAPLIITPGTTITAGTVIGGVTAPISVNIGGIALNPGTPPTLAQDFNIAGFTVPAGTPIPATIPTTGGTTTTPVIRPDIPATTVNASGSISTLSGLVNLYYDFDSQSNWQPYIGGGIGVSLFSAYDLNITYPGTTFTAAVDDSTLGFVYQLMAGIGYYFNPRTAITVGYRYFDTFNTSFETPLGEVDLEGVGIHNLEVGVRYFF